MKWIWCQKEAGSGSERAPGWPSKSGPTEANYKASDPEPEIKGLWAGSSSPLGQIAWPSWRHFGLVLFISCFIYFVAKLWPSCCCRRRFCGRIFAQLAGNDCRLTSRVIYSRVGFIFGPKMVQLRPGHLASLTISNLCELFLRFAYRNYSTEGGRRSPSQGSWRSPMSNANCFHFCCFL